MRDAFSKWLTAYPRDPGYQDGTFKGSPVSSFIVHELPRAVESVLPQRHRARYRVEASAGAGGWAHISWVALLDPTITTSVQEGIYIIYLLSLGCERLYLTLNQGCTTLKDAVGIEIARRTLRSRAETMRVRGESSRLRAIEMDLGVEPGAWRGKLYEVGLVFGTCYDVQALPTQDNLVADLLEALHLCHQVNVRGGWDAEDDIIAKAVDDGSASTLEHSKQYRLHRAIERQSGHAKKVKEILGTRCMACRLDLEDVYGSQAAGIIDVHHLAPLASLQEGETVRLDPQTDFAVLCPNCHRAIHRLGDPSDLSRLRDLVTSGMLSSLVADGAISP